MIKLFRKLIFLLIFSTFCVVELNCMECVVAANGSIYFCEFPTISPNQLFKWIACELIAITFFTDPEDIKNGLCNVREKLSLYLNQYTSLDIEYVSNCLLKIHGKINRSIIENGRIFTQRRRDRAMEFSRELMEQVKLLFVLSPL